MNMIVFNVIFTCSIPRVYICFKKQQKHAETQILPQIYAETRGHPAENRGHPAENRGHPAENRGHPADIPPADFCRYPRPGPGPGGGGGFRCYFHALGFEILLTLCF